MSKLQVVLILFISLVFLSVYDQAQNVNLVKNFEGIPWNGIKPPDPDIAAGPNHIVLTVNNGIQIYNKEGLQLSGTTLRDWFSSLAISEDPIDPKIVFNNYCDRWIVFAITRSSGFYLLSVSKTNDPMGEWYHYKFDALEREDGGYIYPPDYTGLGYNSEAIYITSNHLNDIQFTHDFQWAKIKAIKMSDLISGVTSPLSKDFRKMQNKDGRSAKNIKPVDYQFGSSTDFYLVNTGSDGGDFINIWKISDPFGANSSITRTTVNVGSYSSPNDAPQPGGTRLIETNDTRISDCTYNNGYIYGCFHSKNSFSNGSAVRYFKLKVSDYSLIINDVIEQDGISYYYPEIYPDKYGNVVYIFNKSSATDYVGLAWTYRLSDATAPGSISWLQQGLGYYDRLNDEVNRWGDYNGICLDPVEHNKIWFVGEYAKSGNIWGTKVGAVKFDNIPEQVTFTNLIGSENAGGSFTVESIQNPIPSGQSATLIQDRTYTISTNNERFSNWMNSGITYKQHDWNTYNYEYLIKHSFTAGEVGTENQKAKFLNLTHCTINVLVDEQLISGKGSCEFNDPWFVLDNNNTQPGDSWKEFDSYYEPNGKEGAIEKGVFLAQLPEFGKYYSTRALLMQSPNLGGSLGIRNCYFQNWNSSGADVLQTDNSPAGYDQKAIVFNTQDAIVTANYKGSLLSNNFNTISNSSQRKLARTPNGSLHLVYESMGKVWYEKSTDNGTTWKIMNGGKPLVSEDAKHPSIEAYDTDSRIFITYQKKLENGFPPDSYLIELMVYNVDADCPQDILEVWQSNPYSYNANPVVAFDYNQYISNRVAVAFQDNSDSAPGILYRLAGLNSTNLHYEWKSSAARLSGTDGNSVNPSIKSPYYSATISKYNTDQKFHIAFEQLSTGSSVKYSLLNINQSGAVSVSTPLDISSDIFPTYTDRNEKPLVTVVNKVPYISWLHYTDWTYLHEAALARNTSGSWNLYNRYGKEDDITSVHMNNVALNGFVLAWNVDGYGNEFVKSTSMATPYFTNTTGRDIQVANGTDFTNTRLISFMNDAVPYYFMTSNPMSAGTLAKGTLSKEKDGQNVSRTVESRTGIIKINGASFRASLGEIKAGESDVMFKEIEKDFTPGEKSFLRALESMEFEVSDKTILSYLSEFTFNDSAKTVFLLQGNLESLSFSLELVDVRSGEVLKKLSSKTFNGNSIVMGKPQAFRLDLNGIGSRIVKLRISYGLKVKNSLITEYILLNSYRPEGSLKKENYVDLSYSEVKPVTEYGLSQNYPNPFNPTTLINYQIPKASKVMFKIFDMLGKEVTTLVNEYKEQGRYSVEFNASSLPSGTYIYEIRANNFVKSGKMLLLK